MGDTKNEILDAVKLLLGIKDNDKDDVLMLLIEDTVNSVLAYCRIDVLPRQIVSFIPTLTAACSPMISCATSAIPCSSPS